MPFSFKLIPALPTLPIADKSNIIPVKHNAPALI